MATMLELLQPSLLPLPLGNCPSGKASMAYGRGNNKATTRKRQRNGDVMPVPLAWVTLQTYAVSSGYSVGALRQKMRRGQFIEGKHFRKAPDGRVLMNIEACQNWGI